MGIEDLQELRRLHRAKICDQLGNDLRELMGCQCPVGCHVGGVSHHGPILPLSHQIPVEPLLQIRCVFEERRPQRVHIMSAGAFQIPSPSRGAGLASEDALRRCWTPYILDDRADRRPRCETSRPGNAVEKEPPADLGFWWRWRWRWWRRRWRRRRRRTRWRWRGPICVTAFLPLEPRTAKLAEAVAARNLEAGRDPSRICQEREQPRRIFAPLEASLVGRAFETDPPLLMITSQDDPRRWHFLPAQSCALPFRTTT